MRRERYIDLASDVYNFVFAMLDGEPDFTGFDAADVAHKTETAFKAAMFDWLHEEMVKPDDPR